SVKLMDLSWHTSGGPAGTSTIKLNISSYTRRALNNPPHHPPTSRRDDLRLCECRRSGSRLVQQAAPRGSALRLFGSQETLRSPTDISFAAEHMDGHLQVSEDLSSFVKCLFLGVSYRRSTKDVDSNT